MSARRSRRLRVDVLARVEGEGALDVRIDRSGRVDARLEIYEPPRLFEALLRGRSFLEAPDITARICGICPVAYQMSAAQAMESACGVAVEGPLRDLRRALYCGEWIESHALHVHLLHAPDFLGYEGGVEMAKDHPEAVARGLRIKKAGNDLVALIAGREIHPVGARVGGFWRLPDRPALRAMVDPLRRALDDALETTRWVATLPIPGFTREYVYVALRHPTEYAMLDGRIVSTAGLDVAPGGFEAHLVEDHVPHSNALHATVDGRRYLTGPLARWALNRERLSPLAREVAGEAGLERVCDNPFATILVRAVETVHALDEAVRILETWEPPDAPYVPVPAREARGCGASEAPRGLLFHRYDVAADGTITDARIVPPTAQNLGTIEEDLVRWVESHGEMSDARLGRSCEQAVRNHDPCISCATHFLKARVVRT